MEKLTREDLDKLHSRLDDVESLCKSILASNASTNSNVTKQLALLTATVADMTSAQSKFDTRLSVISASQTLLDTTFEKLSKMRTIVNLALVSVAVLGLYAFTTFLFVAGAFK